MYLIRPLLQFLTAVVVVVIGIGNVLLAVTKNERYAKQL